MNPSFEELNKDGKLAYTSGNVDVFGIQGAAWFEVEGWTAFLYVQQGSALVNGDWVVRAKQYACINSGFIRAGSDCVGFLVRVGGYLGLEMVGGPLEATGRLQYIDGCTDTMIIPPPKLGEPNLNHLHFPPGISQSQHTHPSLRIGMVAKGRGQCATPFGTVEMYEGMLFVIKPADGTTAEGQDGQQHPVGAHGFITTSDHMDVVAFHPDSSFGPTDEDHQMLNQTDVLP